LLDGGVGEGKLGAGELGGEGAGAGEQGFVGHLAHGDAEGKGGRGEERGAMDGVSEGSGELGVGDGLGGGEVERAGEAGGVEGEEHGRDGVREADPAHPLAAGAEAATETKAEEGNEFGECARIVAEDYSEAEVDDANAGIDGGLDGGFPVLTDLGEEAMARSGGFVEDLVAAIAVDSGG